MSNDIDVSALRAAAAQEVTDGLAACQVAVARDGEVVYFESFGTADDETRFGVASATKPIVASATWHLIGEGLLDLDRRVVDYVPEFGTNGKDAVTVDQVYLMTCGFPTAPMEAAEGADPARRRARFAEWELEYEPGTQYVYHGGSAHWVLAELIQRLGGMDFRDYVEERVTAPARPAASPRDPARRADEHRPVLAAEPARDASGLRPRRDDRGGGARRRWRDDRGDARTLLPGRAAQPERALEARCAQSTRPPTSAARCPTR